MPISTSLTRLSFGSKIFTLYTPQKNGLIERFFRSLEQECVWQPQLSSFEQAPQRIIGWIR
ncbi:MAG: integrase core domain-containing protein [Nitrospira sp.]|nr:integrase core domain-containing protein [Nitrospira sp.]MCA9456615.1 integrase core domain-containing protein [Nitrospira sp.]